jgi:uncharacterized membrane protein YjdF
MIEREWRYRNKRNLLIIVGILGIIFFIFLNIFLDIGIKRLLTFLIIMFIFYFIDKIFNFEFKKIHYVFVILIAIFGFLLMFIDEWFLYYDKILHFTGAVMLACIIHHIVKKSNPNAKYVLIMVIFLTLGFAGFHEIYEFLSDLIFNTKTQGVFLIKNGIYEQVMSPHVDTMIDLILGFLGSLVYVSGVLLFRKRKN